MHKTLKIAAQISLLYFLGLLIAAICFYKERMLFVDAPWVVFNIINSKTFAIQEHRYGSFITQMFPLAGVWLGLPLKIILILYSAGFNLFYLSTGLLLYRMKQYKWLLLLGFYFSLMVSSSYFWTNNEVHQGVCWMIISFGSIFYMEKKTISGWLKYIVFFMLSFLAVFTHPLIILASGFLWVYFLIVGEDISIKKKSSLIYSIIITGIWLLKCYYSLNGWYDGPKIDTVTKVSIATINEAVHGKTMHVFLKSCLTNYWICSGLFFAGLLFLIKQKSYLLLFWLIVSFSVSTILVFLINTDAKWFFYIESEWMFLSILSVVVFVWHMLQKIKSRSAAVLVGGIFIVRFTYILTASSPFEARLITLKNIIEKAKENHNSKMIIEREGETSLLEQNLLMSWAMPIETLFISSMQGDSPAITVGYYSSEQIKVLCPKNLSDFSTTFFTIPFEKMNHQYFKYDTTSQYHVIKAFFNK